MSDNPILQRIQQQTEKFKKPTITIWNTTSQVSSLKNHNLQAPQGSQRDARSDLGGPSQTGCSTFAPGGYRNKVSLKPGHSALDWYELINGKRKGEGMVTGMDKHITNQNDGFFRVNHPHSLLQLQRGVPPFMITPQLKFTKEMVRMHNSTEDCWCIINGKIYSISFYFGFHPGGDDILKKHCSGIDATRAFIKYHKWVNVNKLLESCLVGEVIN